LAVDASEFVPASLGIRGRVNASLEVDQAQRERKCSQRRVLDLGDLEQCQALVRLVEQWTSCTPPSTSQVSAT
jgi:hypothetical protein